MRERFEQSLVDIMQTGFDKLGGHVEIGVINDLAGLIYKGMTVQARKYHNLDHVFGLVDEKSPFLTIAALFHDLVYYQVDRGFLPEIRQIIDPYIREEDGQIRLIGEPSPDDRQIRILLEIFDFSPGQVISPVSGINEFLSALVMNKRLTGLLTEANLFVLTLCIEATIPFRESARTGDDHFNMLERRAIIISDHWDLGISPNNLRSGLKQAVELANRDVESFAEPDVACYLETSWKLLAEQKPDLRKNEHFSIREYRQALLLMQNSMIRLDPDRIFHQYRDVPPEKIYHRMAARARQNLATAKIYLQLKLIAQAVLEALAEETGGDMPLSAMIGEKQSDDLKIQRLEDYLPVKPVPDWLNPASPIYQFLAGGYNNHTAFDLHTSPLALFIYKTLPPDELARIWSYSEDMFAARISTTEFLETIPAELLSPIATACAEITHSRRNRLLGYVK